MPVDFSPYSVSDSKYRTRLCFFLLFLLNFDKVPENIEEKIAKTVAAFINNSEEKRMIPVEALPEHDVSYKFVDSQIYLS